MSLSLRDFAVKFGSLIQAKVAMGCKELLPIAEFAGFPKMSNIEEGGQDAIKSDFPEGGTLYVDMPSTLRKGAVVLSEGFIKTNLCGGGSQFVPPKVKADVEKLDFPDKVTEMPDLEEYEYQEITYESFDIDNWEMTGVVEYRVVYEGVLAHLSANEPLTNDPAKGEAHIKGLKGGLDSPAKIKKFLTEECLVYAVLTP